MTKWEYKIVELKVKRNFFTNKFEAGAMEAELNRFGEQGWELVHIDKMYSKFALPPILTFKRLL